MVHTYIALLRGINVSGKNIIKMNDLRLLFENLNFTHVNTYIQSGNVVFKTTSSKPEDLEKQITLQIKKEFGFEVPVIILNSTKLNTIYKENPFVIKRKEDIAKLHLTLLSQIPDKLTVNKLNEGNFGEDEFEIIDKAVYLFCPTGYGKTKLNNTFFESKLKVKASTRNWKTITELVTLSS